MMRYLLIVLLAAGGWVVRGASATMLAVPAGIDHADWDRLLRRYVDDRGRVDYRAWQASADDREALQAYLARFAAPANPPATTDDDDRAASLINAYNALTVRWILEHYPVDSIKSTDDPWGGPRHVIGGHTVSLDDIEHGTLRPRVGYRVHAALVCAARSCPPLRREAYRARRLDEQLNDQMRAWLGREDLNRFLPDRRRVVLSQIFNWFRADFDQAGGTREVLRRFAPARHRALLATEYEVSYLPYDWRLNDAE